MDLNELKTLHDKAFTSNQTTREKAADDLVFYWITQWDDQLIEDTPLQYKGQFDVLRKAGRQIMADLRLNPVQPDFKPKDEARDDDAELLDGMYRADDRKLASQEAYDYAAQDAVVCGFGVWELFTEFATNQVGDDNQIIRRRYIPEGNNTVFFDPNSKCLDKSDSKYVSIIDGYTPDGYKELVLDLTGEEVETTPASFAQPEDSFVFPWTKGQETIYIATIYKREKVKDKVLTLRDPFGEELLLRESSLEDVMDELIDSGYEVVSEKTIQRWQVIKYICSGSEILSEDVISGDHIPVVPCYGERAIIEGEEHYEGITRLAKDPQRLRNFQLSYLADIASRSPRPKPIFNPEQIEGFEFMYEDSGAENNYPYLLQNRFDANGAALPIGPVAAMPDALIPQALSASIELTKEAIQDVADAGIPQDIADPDLSGKAVLALQSRMDQQSYIYQHNFKFAKRRDAEIYASIASQIFDAPRTVSIQTPDGNTKQTQLMRVVIDGETGEPVTLNDLTNLEFDVYAEIGQSYNTQKEQTLDRLTAIHDAIPEGNPAKELMLLKLMELTEGVAMDDVRDFARKQLILGGFKEPETEEEMQLLAQAQQNQQPSAADKLAEAEVLKGQAAMAREQRQAQKDAADAQNDVAATNIDAFEAQTGRMKAQIDAAKAQAEIKAKNIQAFGSQVDSIGKLQQSAADRLRASLDRQNI